MINHDSYVYIIIMACFVNLQSYTFFREKFCFFKQWIEGLMIFFTEIFNYR